MEASGARFPAGILCRGLVLRGRGSMQSQPHASGLSPKSLSALADGCPSSATARRRH